MNKTSIAKFVNSTKRSLAKHSPAILTGIGIVGMITTTVIAVKATPKALQLIEEAERIKAEELDVEECNLTPVEVVRVTWKPYIPALITAITSGACLIGAHTVHGKRNAALATAYKISETALLEYRDKVIETIGENKEAEVRQKVAQAQIDKNPPSTTQVFITEKGNTTCYDAVTGRYFKSDMEKIRKAVNDINYQLTNENYISLNEFYYELGLPTTDLGDILGWNIENGLVEVAFTSILAEDGTPCLAIQYQVAPRYDYRNLH